MNQLKHFLLILAILTANFSLMLSAGLEHFTFTANTGNNATLVIPTTSNPSIGLDPLSNGDEIGVFTPSGLCVGAAVWEEIDIAITVWGDDSQTVPVDGAVTGQQLYFRVWDKSTSTELSSVSVTYDLGSGNYAPNDFYILASLTAAAKPGKPTFTNPTNNAVGVALNGNLTWNAAPGATSHIIQLSALNNFTNKIIEQQGNFTSYPYTNLAYNTTYYARSRGVNAEGDGDWETISFKTLLATPTLVSPANNAKGLNESSVNLSWNSVSGATSYRVQFADNPGFSNYSEQTVAGTSATFIGLNVFTDYYWMVQALDGSNSSTFSPSRTFKTRVGTTTITSPANNAVGVSVSGNLVWTTVTGATSYDVMLVKLPATTVINQNVATTQTAYSKLEKFANYEIRVTAKNADGSGSQVTSTFRTILGVPSLSTPTNNAYNQPLSGNVTWSAVTGAVNYDVRIASDPAMTNIVQSQTNLAATTFAYSGFTTNQKYYWQVRAKNAEGTGDYSSAYYFTTILAAPVLTTPVNNATQISHNPTLQWNSLPGATDYQVQVSTNNTFTQIITDNSNVTTTSFGLSNLGSKTPYYWRVRGYNANSNGQFSNAFMFTTMLGKVNLLSPSNASEGAIASAGTLSWQTLSGATSYDLLVSTNANLSNPIINTNLAQTSYNYTNLNNNTTYYWAVRGKDIDGNGAWSDTWSFGTQVLAPTLLTPANNATNVVLQGSCTWTAVAGATSYQLQMSTDAGFSNIVFNLNGIVGTSGNYEGLQNNTTHYWRVRGYKGSGAGIWSGSMYFKTMTLAPPTPIFPPNNSIDLYTNVTFVWNQVGDATGYNFRYATDANFLNILGTVNNIHTNQYTLNNLFADYTYYWQVQTVGSQGTSNWSPGFKFSTISPIVINGPETICEGRTAVYTTTVSPLVDYSWTVTGGTISGSSTSHTVNVNWGAAGQGTVKLTRSSAIWGSYTDNLTKTVTKTSLANVEITLNANTYYANKACRNEIVTLSAVINSSGTFTYLWKLNNNVVSTSQNFDYHFTTAGTYVFNFIATGLDCEAGQNFITVIVDENCPITIVNQEQIYTCKDASPILTTKVFGGSGQFSYSWSPSSDFVNASIASPIVKSALYTKNFYLDVTDLNSGNTASDLINMVVRQSPSVSFSPSSLVVRNNNPVDITDPGNVTITITGGQAPYTQYWEDNSGNQIDPTSVYPNLGTNRYYLTAIDNYGCSSVAKRFTIIRYSSKDNMDNDLTVGITGEGVMYAYPNPVVNNLNIVADLEEAQNVRVRILNLLGQEVFSLDAGTIDMFDESLNLEHLTSGVYTLVIETQTNTFAKPFIKK